jgi:lipopolysaccharide transport system ATP-binding protein
MPKPIIEIDGIGKRYRIRSQRERYLSLRDEIATTLRRLGTRDQGRKEDFWALRDVSFSVDEGEAVGIIGRNGSGKSTLLKILSRITPPTEGRIAMRGRVASLLEVGTGFHPELTGRENVYLNGAILGMSRAEVKRKFDEIVAFSEVEKFLDTPVKRFSSGMYVRLAFAVAAHLEPEILLIDEVLAVGDAAFQRKCLGKMGDVTRAGRTVLFVSHNMAAVEHLCERAMLVQGGQLAATGPTSIVVSQYLSSFDAGRSSRDLADPAVPRRGTGEARFVSVAVLSVSGESVSCVPMGQGIRVRLEVEGRTQLDGLELAVGIFSANGLRLCGFNSRDLAGFTLGLHAGESLQVDCVIPRMNLSPGTYRLNVLTRKRDRELADLVERAASFEVAPADIYGTGRVPAGSSLIFLDATWERADHAA